MEKDVSLLGTDCRDCRLFYGYRCNLNLGKNHIWDYCGKFKPRRTMTLKEIQDQALREEVID
jgi:hypothetical protein